jgi:hypothetical protein
VEVLSLSGQARLVSLVETPELGRFLRCGVESTALPNLCGKKCCSVSARKGLSCRARHRGLICQNHLIEVAAYGPPEVRLLLEGRLAKYRDGPTKGEDQDKCEE